MRGDVHCLRTRRCRRLLQAPRLATAAVPTGRAMEPSPAPRPPAARACHRRVPRQLANAPSSHLRRQGAFPAALDGETYANSYGSAAEAAVSPGLATAAVPAVRA